MNEFKVGILTLIALASLAVLVLKVGTNKGGFGEYITYRTIINDAAGIYPKTSIKVAGITAGRILDIQLTSNQALVTFEVRKDVKITKFSILKVRSVGMLGEKYLEIQPGDQDAPRLKEYSLIPSETGGGIDDLTKDAAEILSDVKAVIKSIRESISPKGGDNPLVQIMENMRELSENTKEASASIRKLVGGNEERLSSIIANLDKMTESMAFQTDSKEQESVMAQLKKLGPVLDNAKVAMEDLKAVMGNVKAGKGTIGKLLNDEEVIDHVNETLSGVRKMVNRVDAIQTQLSLFTNYNTGENGRSDFNLDVYTSPERFFKLGVVTSEFGPRKEREIVSTVDGRTTIENRKETEKNSFRFNFQIGRVVHNWSFRAGVFQSSGGFGVDYRVNAINTQFTFEAFDYRKSLGPNLRFISETALWNVIYGRVAVEDIISKKDEESITLGAGLKFSDEDIKGLLGFLLR